MQNNSEALSSISLPRGASRSFPMNATLRGGEQEDEKQIQQCLFEKIRIYRESLRQQNNLNEEFRLYIEPRVKNNDTSDNDSYELALNIKKDFLENEVRKVLLLTGAHGGGKTLFCRFLTKSLLFDCNPEDQETEWLPIYIDLGKIKESPSCAITQILEKEFLLNLEEIRLLQTSLAVRKERLRLLLIFDGYEWIQDNKTLRTEKELIQNNFYSLAQLERDWGDAKVIVTCRETDLSELQRRDLLFAPIDLKTGSAISGTFIERKIQLFSKEEIVSYLKKYIVFKQSKSESSRISFQSDMLATHSDGKSWSIVEKYEEMIDSWKIRKQLTTPFFLSIAAEVIYEHIENLQGASQLQDKKSQPDGTQKDTFSNCWQLFRAYIDHYIHTIVRKYTLEKGITEGDKGFTNEDIFSLVKKKILDQALLANKYPISINAPAAAEHEKELNDFLSKYSSTIGWNQENLIQGPIGEYLTSTRIEEELNEYSNSNTAPSNNPLINQKLTKRGSIILEYLVHAVRKNTINPDALIRLIQSFKQHKIQNASALSSHQEEIKIDNEAEPSFANAASNAITILNCAGYDFSNMDLSFTKIPHSVLSNGIFEGTDFTGADLTGVNFREAYLKDADFTNAKLTRIRFDASPELRINEEISSFAYSKEGNMLAIAAGKNIYLYERDPLSGTAFRQKTSFHDRKNNIVYCIFSADRTRLLSVGLDETNRVFCTTEINTAIHSELGLGQARSQTDKHYRVSADGHNVLFVGSNGQLSKWNGYGENSIHKFTTMPEKFSGGEFSSDGKMILTRSSLTELRILNFTTERSTRVFKRNRIKGFPAQFSPDDKQVVFGLDNSNIALLDPIRSHVNKQITFPHEKFNNNYTMSKDGKQIVLMTANKLIFQDIADPNNFRSFELPTGVEYSNFTLAPDEKQVALIRKNVVKFLDLGDSVNWPELEFSEPRGPNHKGLVLNGANIDVILDIPEEGHNLFTQRGDYAIFKEDTVKNVIFNPDPKSITSIRINDDKIGDTGMRVIGRGHRWSNVEVVELKCNLIGDANAKIIKSNIAWTKLRKLDLSFNLIGDEIATALAENKSWVHLEELLLKSNQIGDRGAKAIGADIFWKKLRVLHLGLNKIGDEGLIAITKNSTWSNLEEMYLNHNQCQSKNILASLSSNTTWMNLQVLELQGNPFNFDEKSAIEVITTNNLKNLRSLMLPNASFDLDLLKYIRDPTSEKTSELDLKCNDFSEINAAILSDCSWDKLRVLKLTNNRLGDSGAAKLAANTTAGNLKELRLGLNAIGDAGGAKLAKNESWINLATLYLESNKIGNKGAAALSTNTSWKNLQHLNLADNQFEAVGVRELGKNQGWKKLIVLDLTENKIGEGGLSEISRNENWPKLEVLNLAKNKLNDEDMTTLSQNNVWCGLRELDISNNAIDDAGAIVLSKNDAWKSLEVINLERNFIKAHGVKNLSANESWKNIRALNLNNNPIGAEGAGFLSQAVWTNLETLELVWSQLGAAGAQKLSRNKSWVKLKNLNLSENAIGDKGATELSTNTIWAQLEKLNLQSNWIGNSGIAELIKNKTWTKLKELNLQNNSIGDARIADLGQNAVWTELRALYLGWNSVGDAGIISLSQSKIFPNLEEISLQGNRFGLEGVLALSKNTSWKKLKAINLTNSSITVQGATALSENTTWVEIEALELGSSPGSTKNNIETSGIKALSQNSAWKCLRSLNLKSNMIHSEGVVELSRMISCKNIRTLNLADNAIGDQGVAILSSNENFIGLQVLDLQGNMISALGAKELAMNATWVDLKVLNLQENTISDDGAAHLSRYTCWVNLVELNLAKNSIGEKGAGALGENITWKKLEKLNLRGNQISSEGAKALARNITWSNLRELDLFNNNSVEIRNLKDSFNCLKLRHFIY